MQGNMSALPSFRLGHSSEKGAPAETAAAEPYSRACSYSTGRYAGNLGSHTPLLGRLLGYSPLLTGSTCALQEGMGVQRVAPRGAPKAHYIISLHLSPNMTAADTPVPFAAVVSRLARPEPPTFYFSIISAALSV